MQPSMSTRRRAPGTDLRFQPTGAVSRVGTITRITLTLGAGQPLPAAVLTGAAILLFRNWLEADMARHMLIEFPLLLVAGLGTAKALPERAAALITRSNQLRLAGFTVVSLTAAHWMVS